MSHYRLNLFIQPEHAKRLDELAAKKGVSKSSIVAAALASWLSPDAADQREAAIAKRLDRLSRQAERMERDQNIAIETLALFIRYYLTVSTPVPEAAVGFLTLIVPSLGQPWPHLGLSHSQLWHILTRFGAV